MAFRDSINDLMFRFYERFKQNNNRLPVSVDADINVGDVQIGTVKQGGVDEGAEPWKVKAEELEQKIDALKQSIESGVQLKGQNVVEGESQSNVEIAAGASLDVPFNTVGFREFMILVEVNAVHNYTVEEYFTVATYGSSLVTVETIEMHATGSSRFRVSDIRRVKTSSQSTRIRITNESSTSRTYTLRMNKYK